jgi:4-hydroxy-tetrahydrodipicolinate reductase
MTRIVITGAAGRMGRTFIRCAASFKDLRLVAAIEKPGDPSVGRDAGTVPAWTQQAWS